MPLYYLGIHRKKKQIRAHLFPLVLFSVSLTCFLTVRHQSPDNKIGPHPRRPIISVATFFFHDADDNLKLCNFFLSKLPGCHTFTYTHTHRLRLLFSYWIKWRPSSIVIMPNLETCPRGASHLVLQPAKPLNWWWWAKPSNYKVRSALTRYTQSGSLRLCPPFWSK